jgi:hypothetical protein
MAKTLNDILDAAIQDEIGAQKFYLGALVNIINKRDVSPHLRVEYKMRRPIGPSLQTNFP